MHRLAQELRKVGRVLDAKYIEKEVVSFARRLSTAPSETVSEQDAEFLAKLADRQQRLPPNTRADGAAESTRFGPQLDRAEPRPQLNWADQ